MNPALDDEYLSVALTAAEEAVTIARERPHGDDYETKKGPSDIVTEADRRVEEAIRERILGAYPDHHIVGEEGTDHEGTTDVRWFVDPIDGTTNYQHDIHPSCTMIGIEVDGNLHAGVIWMHHTDDLYYAVQGKGAFKNHEPISVSEANTIEESLFCIEIHERQFLHDDGVPMALFDGLVRVSHGVRKFRCMGHHLMLVAEGKAEVVLDRHTNPWDAAAGTLIVREAGGHVTDCEGEDNWRDFVSRPVHVLATNGRVHDAVLEEVRNVADE